MKRQLRQLILLVLFGSPFFSLGQTNDSSSYTVIGKIIITGLKNTKERVIYRELSFQSRDTIYSKDSALFHQAKQNLINTSLFNFVEITSLPITSNLVDIHIELIERWHWWPSILLEYADPNFNVWWQNKDLNRINYGLSLSTKNFRGMRESFSIYGQLGYTKQAGITYITPFLEKSNRFSLGFGSAYKESAEIVYSTKNNKRVFFNNELSSVREDFSFTGLLGYRKSIFNKHRVLLKYQFSESHDSIPKLINYYGNEQSKTNYFTVQYSFTHDNRDVIAYPLKGKYVNAGLSQYGLGFFNNKLNQTFATFKFNYYAPLSKRLYSAASITFKSTLSNTTPYYFQQGLGYSSFVRGYEYYVIDGQHWSLVRTNLKYLFLKKEKGTINFLKSSRFNTFHYSFFLNAFIDYGYVKDTYYSDQNSLNNSGLFGYGIGIDLFTYYDRVVRFEFSKNRLGEHGFFVHFVKPI